jgi:hypothetical protein
MKIFRVLGRARGRHLVEDAGVLLAILLLDLGCNLLLRELLALEIARLARHFWNGIWCREKPAGIRKA